MRKVTKIVIPAAGMGTRFLPATKNIPKEMLPIVDKPLILYSVEEAIQAGIEDIIIVSNKRKEVIQNFFETSYELEQHLEKHKKTNLLQKIRDIKNMCNITVVEQKEALGLGHAILHAQPIIGEEPFAVILSDEIIVNDKKNVTSQLIDIYKKTNTSAVAISKTSPQNIHNYGVVYGKDQEDKDVFEIENIIEKPKKEEAPSLWTLPGRYVFKPEIFECLIKLNSLSTEELTLTEAMTILAKEKKILAVKVTGNRYDAGNKLGYLQANVEFGLKHPELKLEFKKYLTQLVQDF